MPYGMGMEQAVPLRLVSLRYHTEVRLPNDAVLTIRPGMTQHMPVFVFFDINLELHAFETFCVAEQDF